MKIRVSKCLILLMLINLIVPCFASASADKVLYNCGEIVLLSEPMYTYNGKDYIDIEELYLLNLNVNDKSISDYEKELKFYTGSSIVEFNGTSMLYPNSTIKSAEKTYISFDLIVMLFSKDYSIDGDNIYIWIASDPYETTLVRGTVSLPNGDMAPEGGITIDVFVGYPKATSGGSGSNAGGVTVTATYPAIPVGMSLGLNGSKKPDYSGEIISVTNDIGLYTKIVEDKVTIEEGENSVEFVLNSSKKLNYKYNYVGFSVNDKDYNDSNVIRYMSDIPVYEFTIGNKIGYINGSISISENTLEDTPFTVIAEGNNTFAYNGAIKQGENTADYSMKVYNDSSYCVQVLFDEGKYKRKNYDNEITLVNNVADGIDLCTEKSDTASVTLALPDNQIAESDIEVNVTLQSLISPYYYLDRQTAIISAGNNSASVTLYDDIGTKNRICYYSVNDAPEGIYCCGHYSSVGTTCNSSYAEVLGCGNLNVAMTLLKSKTIDAKLRLPDNELAESDVRVSSRPYVSATPVITNENIQIAGEFTELVDMQEINLLSDTEASATVPENNVDVIKNESEAQTGTSTGGGSGGGGGGSVAGPIGSVSQSLPNILKGSNAGSMKVILPDEAGYRYKLCFNVYDDSEKYYNTIWYREESSTVLNDKADVVDSKTDTITFELMKQNKISGVIDSVVFEGNSNRIYAGGQNSSTIRNDIYESDFSVYTDIYGNGEYNLFVPSEIKDYILRLDSPTRGYRYYYSPGNCVKSIDDAEILTINSDRENVDFECEGYNPSIPITLSGEQESDNNWYFEATNISDYEKDNISLKVCFYDANGKFQNVITHDFGTIERRQCYGTYINIPNTYMNNADTVKFFVWSDLRPMSEVCYLKNNGKEPVSEKEYASLYMKVGDNVMYCNGNIYKADAAPMVHDGCIYMPIRALAEPLEWNCDFNPDDYSMTFRHNDDILKVYVNSSIGYFNDTKVELSAPPIIVNSRTFIPVVSVADVMGYEVKENIQSGIVAIYNSIDSLVKSAFDNGLVSDKFNAASLTEELTRSELASLVVGLYEKVMGTEISVTENPFSDTDDVDVLKVCSLGLLSGFEDGTFRPDNFLTDSEIAKIVHSTLAQMNIQFPTDFSYVNDFIDIKKDGYDWAERYVYGVKSLGLFEGIFTENFYPNNNISKRNAIALIANCYNYFDVFFKTCQRNEILGAIKSYYYVSDNANFVLQHTDILKVISGRLNGVNSIEMLEELLDYAIHEYKQGQAASNGHSWS